MGENRMVKTEELKFNAHGLIPAIVVDAGSGKVLTLAYMSRESLQITIEEGRTCFWSRSRQTLWRKGETSGNIQRVVDITADCDRDALVIRVNKEGPACHLGNDSCFQDQVFVNIRETPPFSVQQLYTLLRERKEHLPEGSYTTYLFEKGIDKILKKVGEESTEVVIAGKSGDKAETIYEIADLMYHVMVLMVEMGIPLEDVAEELASRHIIDHKVKQEKMVK